MGIGFFEICIIALFVLIFFGPQKLPEMMKEVGKFFIQAKRMSNEVKGHVETIMNEAEMSVLAEEEKTRGKNKPVLNAPPTSLAPPHAEAYEAPPVLSAKVEAEKTAPPQV